jgi:hypothetical protein
MAAKNYFMVSKYKTFNQPHTLENISFLQLAT